MYQIGDVVIYGNRGVFRIENIGVPDIAWLKSDKEYYTLVPLYREENVFAPVDTPVFMRKIMSKDEALKFIEQIPNVEPDNCECTNSRGLETHYQTAVASHDCTVLLSIIKRIHNKRVGLRKTGKKLAQIDEKYITRAEGILHEELAAALGVGLSDVPQYIEEKLKEA